MKKIKELDVWVIVRTVALFIAFANQILSYFGISPIPFDQESFATFLSIVITGVVSVWTWWKNNSFTKAAIEADKYKDQLKGKN